MEEKIVWTNGCFDILHRGHIELFKHAKSLGTKLLVGIDSDEKVSRDKGLDRPFTTLKDRKFILESIKYIDEVMVFDTTDGLNNLIKEVKPFILIIGSDWTNKTVVGEEHAQHVRFFERMNKYSTTNILEWKKDQK
jgi:D-beta-D-heptose 7-phosphate kinase/D-beta-D-heptose 1-phosphate adenosyltransferase